MNETEDEPAGDKPPEGKTERSGQDAGADHGEHPKSPEPSDEASEDSGDPEGAKDENSTPIYKKPLFWIIGGIALVVIIIGGTLWWLHARQFESTDDAFVDAHIVRLAPQVSGTLSWVAQADNRHVHAGDLLAVIEPSNLDAQRQQAVADAAQAEAQIKQAEGQVTVAQANRAKAAADTIAFEAAATKAANDLHRYQNLTAIDRAAVAATQLDAARADAESKAGQVLSARKQVAANAADVIVAQRQIAAAQAQYRAAEAKTKQADVTLGYAKLTAPVSGQVVQRSVNTGSYVAPGTQLLAIVPDDIWITANFKETQLAHMVPGQHVAIQVDAFPGIRFEGHVDSIEHGAGQAFALLPPQNATGNYVKVVQRVPVRILFDVGKRDGRDLPDPRRWAIGPGMSVTPTVKVR